MKLSDVKKRLDKKGALYVALEESDHIVGLWIHAVDLPDEHGKQAAEKFIATLWVNKHGRLLGQIILQDRIAKLDTEDSPESRKGHIEAVEHIMRTAAGVTLDQCFVVKDLPAKEAIEKLIHQPFVTDSKTFNAHTGEELKPN